MLTKLMRYEVCRRAAVALASAGVARDRLDVALSAELQAGIPRP